MNISFEKYQLNGNNFIIIDERVNDIQNHAELASRLCDVTQSVGADSVLFIGNSDRADARMRIFEQDGTESDMCGNGIRCIVLYLHRLTGRKEFSIETNSGIMRGVLNDGMVQMDVGTLQDPRKFLSDPEKFTQISENILWIQHAGKIIYILNSGEPHAVMVDDTCETDLRDFMEFAKNPSLFPRGINLNVLSIQDRNMIRNRTLERGVWNYTTSCGTGSICCAAIARELGCNNESIVVINDIGSQQIQFNGQRITSVAQPNYVYKGVIEIGGTKNEKRSRNIRRISATSVARG